MGLPDEGERKNTKENKKMTDILTEIEMLMEQGYSEEQAEKCVALLTCSDDEVWDLWNED